MAPVIFGLDLADMSWGKFKSSYMFGNRDYHLRRTKFIVYQLALIFCVFSESLGTAALSDYVDQQSFAESLTDSSGRHLDSEYNNDYIAVASYNIWSGIFTAFVFGAAFFFDLFWPERREDRGIKLAWKWCGVAACVFSTADVFALTVITATRKAYVTGPDAARVTQMLYDMGRYNLVYRKNGRAVAAVVFVWLGWISTIASAIILWMSIDYTDQFGPFTAHKRKEIESVGGQVHGHAHGGPHADVYPGRDSVKLEQAVATDAADVGGENVGTDAGHNGPVSVPASAHVGGGQYQHGVGATAAAEDLEKARV